MNKFDKIDIPYLKNRKETAKAVGMPDLYEIADHFGLFAGTQTIGRALSVFEIIKQTIKIPGDIVEFGCWKGSNLLLMAKILELLQPNTIKQVHGFDSFEGLKTFAKEDGDGLREIFENRYQGNEKLLREFIRLHGMESWVKLLVGDAMETIEKFEKENPHIMFSLSFIDFDLYSPCKKALEFSDERLSVGGLIVMDEALTEAWRGEGQALREFLGSRRGCYKMHSNMITRQPTVILEKIM
jgi:hypothetical protein